MNLKLQTPQDDAILGKFSDADQMRDQARQMLESIEGFYKERLEQFPDRCEFGLAHERGKIEAMIWQTQQLRSLTTLYFSQAGQDRFIDAFIFNGKKNGTFIEIGGYDGVMGSNCLFFEAIRQWKGIMIEPSPMPMAHAKLFRNCECIEAAISNEAGEAEFINIIDGYLQMSGLKTEMPEETLEVIRAHGNHREEVIKVPTVPLSQILDERNLTQVDYCSLDVEGAEFAILSAFPFDKYDITVWSIENNLQQTNIPELMLDNGYEFLTVLGVDEIYRKINA